MMQLARLVALFGCIITLVQSVLLFREREGICFNSGCEVVDSLTTVPPLFINLGGFVFFLVVFLGLWLARNDRRCLNYVKALLLAGLAAEGVLFSFQHFVAQTFCSYCLIVLGVVVLVNLLTGIRQTITGALVFAAVVAGFSALQFTPVGGDPLTRLESGTFAVLEADDRESGMANDRNGERRYLFFSSTCQYCEEVLETIQGGNNCALRFNPIDTITDFAVSNAVRQAHDVRVNRVFLQSLGLKKIPVLLLSRQSGFQVISGAKGIQEYLEQHCGVGGNTSETIQQSSREGQSSIFQSSAPGFLPSADEACSVDLDCEDDVVE
jgi:uncharacterized membrane protein